MSMILALIFASALTRTEIIDRMRAVPIVKEQGLVQVIADCPSDMRREYQSPIAGFVADICATLARARRQSIKRFAEPGIIVYVGDVRTNVTNVVTRLRTRANGSKFTRIYLPAPAFADVATLRRETTKAFYRAVVGETLDDAAAEAVLRSADPNLRIADMYAELSRWLNGQTVDKDDEHYLRLVRKVLKPGVAYPSDVLRFASSLQIYPEVFSAPFCGRYASCTFHDAIDLAQKDVRIRFLALSKASSSIYVFAVGRGESLSQAAIAYAEFLRALAAYQKTPEELRDMLADADEKLNVAFEEARLRAEGKLQ